MRIADPCCEFKVYEGGAIGRHKLLGFFVVTVVVIQVQRLDGLRNDWGRVLQVDKESMKRDLLDVSESRML